MSEREINKIFTTRLRELLDKKGITYKELATALNINPSAVSMWNSGRSLPRMGMIEKIAKYFNVSPSYLMGWEPISDEEIGDVFYKNMSKPMTIAAHFDGVEYTEEELKEIRKFAEFVKSKRKDAE